METLSNVDIVEKLREFGPFDDEQSALRALTATLETLADFLPSDERAALSRALSPEMAKAVQTDRPTLAPSSDERTNSDDISRRVAAREGVRPSLAIEHAEIV